MNNNQNNLKKQTLKIMFIDESKSKDNKEYLCLCGIIVDYKNLNSLESQINKFKIKNNYSNLKDFRKPEDINKKIKLTKDLKSILEENEIKIISTILPKDILEKIKQDNRNNFESEERMQSLFFILERYFYHINRISKDSSGIVIFDSLDKRIKKQMRDGFYNEIKTNFKNIYPSLFFVNDEYSNIMQVTDLITVSLNSSIHECLKEENSVIINELPCYNEYLNEYWDLFEYNPKNNDVEGWGIKICTKKAQFNYN